MYSKRLLASTLCAVFLATTFAFAQEPVDGPMERAKRLYRNGDYRGAIAELNQVVQIDPDHAEALYLLGYSHLMLREFPESVDAFGRAFEADPTFDPRTIYQRRPPEEPTP